MAEKDRIRTEQFRFYMLPEENAILTKEAYEHGLSKAEYLRMLIVAGGVVGRHWTMEKEQGKQLLYELNRIGNNINQIAYNTNAKKFSSNSDWEKLKKNYFELLKLIGDFPFLDERGQKDWQQQISMLLHKQLEKQ